MVGSAPVRGPPRTRQGQYPIILLLYEVLLFVHSVNLKECSGTLIARLSHDIYDLRFVGIFLMTFSQNCCECGLKAGDQSAARLAQLIDASLVMLEDGG